jgi:ComF family protein
MRAFISMIRQGLSGLIFPAACLCCGEEVVKNGGHICPFCLHKRFEYANSGNHFSSSGVLLPEGVAAHQALWQYDKGGMLQDLMHHLKYERLTDVGTQLGTVLGRRAMLNTIVKKKLQESPPIIVPVPLHYLSFRKRGFNQAFYIGKGIQSALNIPICSVKAVVRKRFTRSQTSLSLEKRIRNINDAFKVRERQQIKGRTAIVVDDVFTTGATSFELAKTLLRAGTASVMIWTVAQA